MSQRTEVRVKKTSERRSLRFAGLEFAPPLTAEERADAEQVLADAQASGDYSKVPPPREPTVAVWADDERHHYVLLGDEEGNPVAVRFKIGPVRDPRRDDMAKGGFVPAKTLQAMQPKPKRRAPGAGGGAGGGGGGGGGADAPAPLTEQQQKRKSELLQRLEAGIKGLAQQGAGQLLGGLIKEGGSLGGAIGTLAGNAGQSLVGMGIGGLLSAGSDAFFSKVWGVDDSSSTGEQVAHHLAQELAGLMQAELQQKLMDGLFPPTGTESEALSWKEQFTGKAAPEGPPMIRMGDKTDHGGVVQSGDATVLVVGMSAARMTDTQVCPKIEPGPLPHMGGTIDQGDPLVFVGGHEAARHDHLSLCTGCGLLAKVVQGQSSVQIGTVSTAPPVAKPKEAPKVGSGGPAGRSGVKGSGGANGSSGSASGQASSSKGGPDGGSMQAPDGADGEPQSADDIKRRILELRKRMGTEDLTQEEWNKLADEHELLSRSLPAEEDNEFRGPGESLSKPEGATDRDGIVKVDTNPENRVSLASRSPEELQAELDRIQGITPEQRKAMDAYRDEMRRLGMDPVSRWMDSMTPEQRSRFNKTVLSAESGMLTGGPVGAVVGVLSEGARQNLEDGLVKSGLPRDVAEDMATKAVGFGEAMSGWIKSGIEAADAIANKGIIEGGREVLTSNGKDQVKSSLVDRLLKGEEPEERKGNDKRPRGR